MATALFDGKKIFSSVLSAGPPAVTQTEGFLWVPTYSSILQKLHFEGEDGDRYLSHGWPDRPWIFRGILCAPDLSTLMGMFGTIQGYIDSAQLDPTTYNTLVDSLGNSYPAAQIHTFAAPDVRITDTGGYCAHVEVHGIIQGMPQDGGG